MTGRAAFGTMPGRGVEHREDLTILHGRVKPGWRRAEGHVLAPGDLAGILAARPAVLVVGAGTSGRLRIPEETRRALAEAGVRLEARPTPEAARRFNDLAAQGLDPAGAFHLSR